MSVAGNAGGASNATVRQLLEIIKSVKLLSPEDFAAVVARWPEARWGEDAGNLAKELVQQGKLTRFQAAAAYQCKPRGLVIGPYLILDRLGAGGMGTVFKGEHREKKTIVAIKVLASSAVRSADSVERFYREARTAARLDHPGIVRALDIGEGDGQHYYVMEYVEGVDLSAYIKKQGPLPLDQAVQVVAQAARALAHAHEHGVIHRDIKPGNLIYTKDGKIKILDMGLARLNDPATLATSQAAEGLTQTGQVMGTVDYMAPEQAVNTRLADARADVYSLGCTFYRLATGKIPFDGESMVEKILSHREQPVPSLGSGTTPVPPAVDHVLRKMLAKKPDDRYQTMNELADDLDKCLSGDLPSGPIVARPLALAAVEAESSSSVTFNLGGAPVPGSINKRHKKGSGLVYVAAAAALIMVVGAGTYYAMELSKVKPTVVADDSDTTPPVGVGDVTDKTSSDSKQPADKTDATPKPNVSVNVETKPNPSGMTPPGPMPITPPPPTGPNLTAPPRAFGAPPPTTTPTGPVPLQPTKGPMPNEPAPFVISPAAPLPATPMPTPMPVPVTPTPAPPTVAPPTVAIEAMIPTEVADTRKELPDQAAIDASIKLIRTDVFKDEYAKAKKPDERVALARKLYDHATQVKDPNADQFAMLSEARDLASEGGDLTLINTSAGLVGANFKVETLEWIVAGIEAAQKKTLSAAINKQIASGLLTKVDEAVRDDKFEVASRLMKAALASAQKSSDPTGRKAVVDRGKQLDDETKQWEVVEKARKTLADKPDDPAANLTLGKYLCFTENDWEKGPAHLAKGSDAALKELGEKSLKAPDKPDDLVAIGDLWWARADKANGPAKKEFQFGALYWYEKSLNGLAGLNKTKVDKRIADAKQAVAGMGAGLRTKGAQAVYLRVPVSPTVSIAMRMIPAGSFTMGSPDNELGRSQEEVQHRVTITKPYFIGVTELTQEQYRAVMGSMGRTYDDNPDYPAHSMYRSMIDSFFQTINRGPHAAYLRFRLPTEAEWEHAARAGTSTAYFWGDNGPLYRDYGVTGGFAPVASLKPNAWGLFDTSGNANEYCNDFYSPSAYTPAAVVDPQGPPDQNQGNTSYVVRGGAHYQTSNDMRSAARRGQVGNSIYTGSSFRIVCEVVNKIPPELFIKDPTPYLRVGPRVGTTPTAVAVTTPTTPTKTTPGKAGANKGGPLAVPSPQVYQQLCEWVWQRSGAVILRSGNSGTRYCYRATDLPQTFDIRGVNLPSSSNITDADLQFVAAIPWLAEVRIYSVNVTNVGVSAIAAMPNLEVISLSNCRQVTETGLAPLANATRLTSVYLFNSINCGKSLRFLVNCRTLTSLNMDGTGVTDMDCVGLEKLNQLSMLNLADTRITDKSLVYIRALRQLDSLYLSNTAVTDAGLANLQGHPDLDDIYLFNTGITNAGIAHLASCTDLDTLNLSRTKITDQLFDVLSRMPSISSLYLGETAITDAGIARIATMANIGYLDLSGCNVTDACAPALARLPRLYSLRVGRTKLTPTALNNIKSVLPNINIYQN